MAPKVDWARSARCVTTPCEVLILLISRGFDPDASLEAPLARAAASCERTATARAAKPGLTDLSSEAVTPRRAGISDGTPRFVVACCFGWMKRTSGFAASVSTE